MCCEELTTISLGDEDVPGGCTAVATCFNLQELLQNQLCASPVRCGRSGSFRPCSCLRRAVLRLLLTPSLSLQVSYLPFTQAFERAKAEKKLVHSILLWGALDDQSC